MSTLAILLVSHSVVAAAAIVLTRLHLRGKAEALDARAAALDTHELFLETIADRERRIGRGQPGRHRAVNPRLRRPDLPPPAGHTPSLLPNRGLAEAVAIIGTRIAQREQEHRAFVNFLDQVRRSWAVPVARFPQGV